MLKRYKSYISIINLQWSYTWRFFITILLLLGIGEGYFLYSNLTKASFKRMEYDYTTGILEEGVKPWSFRFEEYLARSHFQVFFLLAFILTILLLISVSIRQKSVAQTEYTLLRIPVSRYSWFIMNVIFGFCIFTILLGTQFLYIILGYQMYLYYVPDNAIMTQGIFLAFVRWDFLKYLYPITDPLRAVFNLVYVINAAVLATYLNMCILFKNKKLISVFVSIFIYFIFFNKQSIGSSIFTMVILCLAVSWMVINFKGMVEEMGGD